VKLQQQQQLILPSANKVQRVIFRTCAATIGVLDRERDKVGVVANRLCDWAIPKLLLSTVCRDWETRADRRREEGTGTTEHNHQILGRHRHKAFVRVLLTEASVTCQKRLHL